MKEPNDNPPPGGYYRTGEWRDPEPRRNYNVNPDEPNTAVGAATPKKRSWFARLLCAIGLHTDPVWIAHTKWRCYACQREWRDYTPL